MYWKLLSSPRFQQNNVFIFYFNLQRLGLDLPCNATQMIVIKGGLCNHLRSIQLFCLHENTGSICFVTYWNPRKCIQKTFPLERLLPFKLIIIACHKWIIIFAAKLYTFTHVTYACLTANTSSRHNWLILIDICTYL